MIRLSSSGLPFLLKSGRPADRTVSNRNGNVRSERQFTEQLDVNLSLLRRRLPLSNLKAERLTVGSLSKHPLSSFILPD
ncbi:spore germination protein [Bacillus licheniformis]|nr:spore germination protein [Bacillus licheniformis]